LREILVRDDAHLLFAMGGSLAPRRRHLGENTDVHDQAGFRGCGCPEVSDELDTSKNHTLTRSGQVGEQPVLNGIIRGGVGRIVRDPDLEAQVLPQLFPSLFEERGPGAITPAPIA
jgi:hypothetical protein